MKHRSRRLRKNRVIRDLIAETRIHRSQLIQPHFVHEGKEDFPIPSLPGISRMTKESLLSQIEKDLRLGISSILLFPVIDEKTEKGENAFNPNGIMPKTIAQIKKNFGDDINLMTDVCLCTYLSSGHCGILEKGKIHNELTLDVLAQEALVHAEAGADVVAPSDMMDFRVASIRNLLDHSGFQDTAILSYAIKHAGAYYGPFRDAANSAPQTGDRSTYQMDSRNIREGLRDAMQDVDEGSDFLMVKPALPNLDIISRLHDKTLVPIFAYHVSSEYASVKAASAKGWLDGDGLMLQHLLSIKRAGASAIITYAAREAMQKGWFD